MDPTDAHEACFEAGIKFGSLYHQFVGTPVSPSSAASLERAIEEAIGNQPHCESVAVDIHVDDLETAHGYDELTGPLMDAEVVVDYDGIEVVARMETVEGYPLMRIESVGG